VQITARRHQLAKYLPLGCFKRLLGVFVRHQLVQHLENLQFFRLQRLEAVKFLRLERIEFLLQQAMQRAAIGHCGRNISARRGSGGKG